MKKPITTAAAVTPTTTPIDALDIDMLDESLRDSVALLDDVLDRWPGMVRLTVAERDANTGYLLPRYAQGFVLLFKAASTPALAPVLAPLAAVDDGEDPERFEAELLLRRIARVEKMRALADALRKALARVDDEVAHTSDRVVTTGMRVLTVARAVAAHNPQVRSAIAPALDHFTDLTADARRALARKAAAASRATDKPADKPADKPTTDE